MFVTVPLKVAAPSHVSEPVVADTFTAGEMVMPSARVAAEETVRVPVPETSLLKFICPEVELRVDVPSIFSVPV